MKKVSSSNKSKSGETALLLDVGSGSIGGVIVAYKRDKKPRIIYSIRKELPFSKNVTSDKSISSMRLSLEAVLSELVRKGFLETKEKAFGHSLPEYVVCTLSSPWHISTVRDINFNFEEKEEIDSRFLSDLVENEVHEFQDKVDKSELAGKPFEVIEKLFIKFLVNGYHVENPLNKKSTHFNFKIFLSIASNKHLDYIRNTINRHLPGREIIFKSFSSVYFSTLSKIFPHEDRFLAVHISGETTDISVIKDRAIIETASFPLGRNFMVRKITSEIKGLEPIAALSMIKIHKKDESDRRLSKKFQEILKQTADDWIKLFFDALNDLSAGMFLPSRTFVMSGEGYSVLFSRLIEQANNKSFLKNNQSLNLTAIESDLFSSVVDWDGKERSEPFFAIQAFCDEQDKSKGAFNRKFLL